MRSAARAPSLDGVAIQRGVEADLDALNRLYNHFVTTTHVTFDVEPITSEQRLEWFRGFADSGPHQLFVALRQGRFAGFVHSKPFRPKAAYAPSVETTVYLDPEVHGGGIGTALYGELFSALRTEDVHRAYAGIALPNPASVALHQRLGFRSVGTFDEVGRKFGRFWSVQWWERSLGEGSA